MPDETIKYSPEEIALKREQVFREIIKTSVCMRTPDIFEFDKTDLRRIFWLYDRHFLNNYFSRFAESQFTFEVSRRMTKMGGKAMARPGDKIAEIIISVPFVFDTMKNERNFTLAGVKCSCRLHVLMAVMEHEMIHVYETFRFGSTSHGSRFKQLTFDIFGHNNPRRKNAPPPDLDFRVGDIVAFIFRKKVLHGVITNISRRATIIVSSPLKTIKYYVPLQMLTLVSRRLL